MSQICRKRKGRPIASGRAGATRPARQSRKQGQREFARRHPMASGAAARFRVAAPRPSPSKENGMQPKEKCIAI